MKTIKLISLAALTMIAAGALHAGRTPGGRAQERLANFRSAETASSVVSVSGRTAGGRAKERAAASRQLIQPGEHMACAMCNNLVARGDQSKEEATAQCEQGAGIDCASCQHSSVAVHRGPRSKERLTFRPLALEPSACRNLTTR